MGALGTESRKAWDGPRGNTIYGWPTTTPALAMRCGGRVEMGPRPVDLPGAPNGFGGVRLMERTSEGLQACTGGEESAQYPWAG